MMSSFLRRNIIAQIFRGGREFFFFLQERGAVRAFGACASDLHIVSLCSLTHLCQVGPGFH